MNTPMVPDLTHSGNPVVWSTTHCLDDTFVEAMLIALDMPGVDVELVRWPADAEYAPRFVQWWTFQRAALVREVKVRRIPGMKATVRRHTDEQANATIGYIRFDTVKAKS